MSEDRSPESEIIDRKVVYGGSHPNHRLILRFVSVLNRAGWDFYELDWQRKTGSQWHSHRSISAEEFQAGSSLSRWVSELASFDPSNASAIVQVASVDSGDPNYHSVLLHGVRFNCIP